MHQGLEIRPTIEADLPAIVTIYAEAVIEGTGSFELEPPDLSLMNKRWRKRLAHGLPHIVAVTDGQVLGFAYVSRFRSSAAYSATVENSVFVADRAQGRGLGTALLAELIAQCELQQSRQMVALIAADNVASLSLHERFGFKKAGVIEGVALKHGRWLDTVIMQRSLGDGHPSAVARS